MIKKLIKWQTEKCYKYLGKLSILCLLFIFLSFAIFAASLFLGLLHYIISMKFDAWTVPTIVMVMTIIIFASSFVFNISGLMEAKTKEQSE